MAYLLREMSPLLISIALIFTSAVQFSLGGRDITDKEKDLKNLCSDTSHSKVCWNIIKSQYSRFDTDDRGVAASAIDLAIAKANEIHDLLNQLREDSKDDKLKEKYLSCSKNYNDAIRDLDQAKSYLNSNDLQKNQVQIDDALEELKNCEHDFDKDSFDPAHIRNRNREFRVYAETVKVSSKRLVKGD